jgi:Tol biopolymer transport system component
VIATEGGPVQRPVGHITKWQWSPREDVLAGVSSDGEVMVGGPGETSSRFFPSKAEDVVFARDGTRLALGAGNRLAVVAISGGRAETLLATAGTDRPVVAGWSPGGRWVLFWVLSPGRSNAPLNAAPLVGGGYSNIFDPVLPYADFLSWCGPAVVVSGGGGEFPSEGQQLLISEPPGWGTRNLSADFRTSWLWPACSPNGTWIAVTATPNGPEQPPGYGTRSLWLISRDGGRRVRLARAVHFAYETPRWSSDGRFVMAVRRRTNPKSPGTVELIRIDPKTGKPLKTIDSIARLGPAPGRRGHTDWTSISDWYRP